MVEADQLELAIRGLYGVFRYPRPVEMEYCKCGCAKQEEIDPILAAPARELPFEILANYSFSAMTTQGSVDDFKYFLPRLLEGIATQPYDYCAEILFGKLRYAKWLTWTEEEVAAVRRYLSALWRNGLLSYPVDKFFPAFLEIETVLASIASTGDALGSYLEFWTANTSEAANAHLIQFVTYYGAGLAEGRTLNFAFWERLQPQAAELRQWLLRPPTIARIEDSQHLLEKDGFEHLFEPALERLKAESRR